MIRMLLAKISRVSPVLLGGSIAVYMVFAILTFRSNSQGTGMPQREMPAEKAIVDEFNNSTSISDDLDSEPYPKIILFWTTFFGGQNSFLGDEGLKLKDCPVNNCILSDDRTDLNESDALIFHPLDFKEYTDLPTVRQPHQYYIYFVLESPHHSGGAYGPAPDFFNLTFTYRFDSDIIADNYLQYFRPTLWTSPDDFDRLWRNKTKISAIFTSNCATPSKREIYISLLKEHMPVDVYGSCGDKLCPKTEKNTCDTLIMEYKFYFAFENSICKDYISEKIIRAFDAGAVPVVMGGANYSAIFPPDSVIDALNFPSPKALADYLLFLSGSKEAYFRHFKWRSQPQHMKLAPFLSPEKVSLCTLCAMLHAEPRPRKSYQNLEKWWNTEAKCNTPDWTALYGAPRAPTSPQPLVPWQFIPAATSGAVPFSLFQ